MAEVAINQQKLSLKGNGIILAILAGIAMMVMFIEIMLVPALPHIAAEYPQDATWVSWVLSAYLLSGAISTLLLGRLGDIYGKKRVLLIALAGYIIGILGSAFSWSMGSLIAFRAIQGIGMGMFVLSFGIIRDTFPKRLIPVAIGLISAMFSVGVSIGLLAGGYIVSVLSWRDSFYIVAPLMVVMAILVWLFVKDNNLRTPSTIDFVGAGLISGGVLFFLLALTQGESWGWLSAGIIAMFAASLVLISVFIWYRSSPSSS
jgi:MFS family permease